MQEFKRVVLRNSEFKNRDLWLLLIFLAFQPCQFETLKDEVKAIDVEKYDFEYLYMSKSKALFAVVALSGIRQREKIVGFVFIVLRR